MGQYTVIQIEVPDKGQPNCTYHKYFNTYKEALALYNEIKDGPVNNLKYIQTSVEGPTGEILELHKNYRWIRMYTL